ncbi:hypothetical protein F4778DRAFT_102487 [Xylariomycetidae sp. FL2044]|nr:hypothetical protein F4778DRAFT_102487 [Xylariomycetidae sp. FL2044]
MCIGPISKKRSSRPKIMTSLGWSIPGQAGKGFSLLTESTRTGFKFPNFHKAVDRPSQPDIDKHLQQLTDDPPKRPIPYYVGPPLTSDFDSLLHPGDQLSQLGHIPGINTPYWHAGEQGSGTAFHCEDARFRSCNLMLFGWKLWIMIQEEHTAIFEAFIKRNWGGNSCAQFVRHRSLLISPARLRAEKIKFDILVAGPGDMVITAPGQYHAVINLTNCFAIATNFLLPGEPAIPATLAVCQNCGLYPLNHPNFTLVPCPPSDNKPEPEVAVISRDLRPKRAARNKPTPSAPLARQLLPPVKLRYNKKRAAEATFTSGSKRRKDGIRPTDIAIRLVNACSIRRFMTHVTTWRDGGTPIINDCDFSITGSWDERAAGYFKLGERLGHSSKLHKLLSLIARIQVTRDIEDRVLALGYERATPEMIDQILQRLESTVTPALRKKFQDLLKLPRQLIRVLGDYHGLLPLLPLGEDGSVTLEEYRQMSEDDIAEFHVILEAENSTAVLVEMGSLFEKSTLTGVEFPGMLWEKIDAEQLDTLGFGSLVRLLRVRHIDENVGESPDWPKPDDWPGEWPVTPDSLPTGEQCVLCHSSACECIRNCFAQPPRVASYGPKGLGLQATSAARGEVVYKKDERIGQVLGRMVAPGMYEDGFALDLVRADIAGEPTTAQIYTRMESNIFRFVNHRCRHPSAVVRGTAISQRYRVVLYALRDICDGDEITVNWGKDSLGGVGCLCEDCK